MGNRKASDKLPIPTWFRLQNYLSLRTMTEPAAWLDQLAFRIDLLSLWKNISTFTHGRAGTMLVDELYFDEMRWCPNLIWALAVVTACLIIGLRSEVVGSAIYAIHCGQHSRSVFAFRNIVVAKLCCSFDAGDVFVFDSPVAVENLSTSQNFLNFGLTHKSGVSDMTENKPLLVWRNDLSRNRCNFHQVFYAVVHGLVRKVVVSGEDKRYAVRRFDFRWRSSRIVKMNDDFTGYGFRKQWGELHLSSDEPSAFCTRRNTCTFLCGLSGLACLVALPNNCTQGEHDQPCRNAFWPCYEFVPPVRLGFAGLFIVVGGLIVGYGAGWRVRTFCIAFALLCSLCAAWLVLNGHRWYCESQGSYKSELFQHRGENVSQKHLTSQG